MREVLLENSSFRDIGFGGVLIVLQGFVQFGHAIQPLLIMVFVGVHMHIHIHMHTHTHVDVLLLSRLRPKRLFRLRARAPDAVPA